MAESDSSSPCIIGFGSSPSRCGPLSLHARPRSRSPGFRSRSSRTCQGLRPRRTGHALALARIPVSPSAATTASASQSIFRGSMAGLTHPCRRFAPGLATDDARSGPMGFATPSSSGLDHLLLAGLPAHCHRNTSGSATGQPIRGPHAVIASEAKQSTTWSALRSMDCFIAALLATTALLNE